MMEMDFSFEDYQQHGIRYVYTHSLYETWDKEQFRELEKRQAKQDETVKRTFKELGKRTTSSYYRKVFTAQAAAQTFAKKWFPSYKFILPDTLTDDWLSTMDWHKEHQTRDHSLHQTLATYIVSKMLGNGDPTKGLMLSEQESLLSRCASLMVGGEKMTYLRKYLSNIDTEYASHQASYDQNWAVEVFYEAAMIAAQFHDMGYPWQFINTLSKGLREASYGKIKEMLINIDAAYNEIKDRLLIYPCFVYDEKAVGTKEAEAVVAAKDLLKKGLANTHGAPGALGFMCLNDNIRKFSKTDQQAEATSRLILDWAAVGIMMHDMPGLYWGKDNDTDEPVTPILRLDFERDPLSCLISLADILEEFERPLAVFGKDEDTIGTDEEIVEVDYDFQCERSKIEILDGKLWITYYYKQQEDRETWDKIKGRRKQEVWEYLNPKNGYLDLSSWGIVDAEGKAEEIVQNE